MFKRLLAFILSAVLLLGICPCAMAEGTNAVISLSQKSAVPGDSVAINVDISENPGVMAMTFGIKYDPAAFTYEGYAEGYIGGPTVNNDSSAGITYFVSCESNNLQQDGTIVTIMLRVNDTAAPKSHKISIVNINYEHYGSNLKGCFARYKASGIIPKVNAGSVTVGATCTNSPHIFGSWSVEVEPNCQKGGLESRVCSRCGHTENRESKALDHDYEDEWTIDRKATEDTAGQMSRHCKNCDSVTDIMLFTLPEAEDPDINIENNEGEKVDESKAEKLEDFENLQKDNEKPQEPEEHQSPVVNNESQVTNQQQNAEEMVENQQETNTEEQKSELSLYEYLFGNSEQKGVLKVIFESLPKELKSSLPYIVIPILILLIFAI